MHEHRRCDDDDRSDHHSRVPDRNDNNHDAGDHDYRSDHHDCGHHHHDRRRYHDDRDRPRPLRRGDSRPVPPGGLVRERRRRRLRLCAGSWWTAGWHLVRLRLRPIGGRRRLDLACFYFGDIAYDKGATDGEEVNNDYYVRNVNPTLRTVTVDASMPVYEISSTDSSFTCESCGQPVAPTAVMERLGEVLGGDADLMGHLTRFCLACRGTA